MTKPASGRGRPSEHRSSGWPRRRAARCDGKGPAASRGSASGHHAGRTRPRRDAPYTRERRVRPNDACSRFPRVTSARAMRSRTLPGRHLRDIRVHLLRPGLTVPSGGLGHQAGTRWPPRGAHRLGPEGALAGVCHSLRLSARQSDRHSDNRRAVSLPERPSVGRHRALHHQVGDVIGPYGTRSPVQAWTAVTLGHFPGEVSKDSTLGVGNNLFNPADLSQLGSHYKADPGVNDPLDRLDVRPTVTTRPAGRRGLRGAG